jgi:SAM-dependent methyltransferase
MVTYPTVFIERRSEMKLNIGCGPNLFPRPWINVDRVDMRPYAEQIAKVQNFDGWPAQQRIVADFARLNRLECWQHDLRQGFSHFRDGSVEAIYLGQMIEHLNPIYEVPTFLKECHRMLKEGGVIRITTPDLQYMIRLYLNDALDDLAQEMPEFYKNKPPGAQLSYLMFGSAGPQCTWDNYEGHFHLYDPPQMIELLKSVGFHDAGRMSAQKSSHPAMTDFRDEGMSYAFAMEATK